MRTNTANKHWRIINNSFAVFAAEVLAADNRHAKLFGSPLANAQAT